MVRRRPRNRRLPGRLGRRQDRRRGTRVPAGKGNPEGCRQAAGHPREAGQLLADPGQVRGRVLPGAARGGLVMSTLAAGASTAAGFGAAIVIAAFIGLLAILVTVELRGWR